VNSKKENTLDFCLNFVQKIYSNKYFESILKIYSARNAKGQNHTLPVCGSIFISFVQNARIFKNIVSFSLIFVKF
jgi:hypothetical protein